MVKKLDKLLKKEYIINIGKLIQEKQMKLIAKDGTEYKVLSAKKPMFSDHGENVGILLQRK